MLPIGYKNTVVEHELSHREIKKVYEKSDLGVEFYDTFKADNHIFDIVWIENRMIGWMFEILFQRRQMLF